MAGSLKRQMRMIDHVTSPQWVSVLRVSTNYLTMAPKVLGSLASAIPLTSINPAFPLCLCASATQASCGLMEGMFLPSATGPLHRQSPPLECTPQPDSTHHPWLFI